MNHLDEGALRRLLDEHDLLTAAERDHVDGCEICQALARQLRADAEAAQSLLAVPSPSVDAGAALAQMRRRAESTVPAPPTIGRRFRAAFYVTPRRLWRPAAVLTVVAVAAVGLVASGVAQNMVKIFEPQQVTTVPLNAGALGSLPDLGAYGTVTSIEQPRASAVKDLGAAATSTGLHLLSPTRLPGDVSGLRVSFGVLSEGKGSFTFSSQKAAASALASGNSLPALPANLDGSTLFLTAGPAAVTTYGSPSLTAALAEASASTGGSRETTGSGAPGGIAAAGGASHSSILSGIPKLVILQAKAPVVSSNGPSVADYEAALLSLPGIPPDLAAQIKAIGDPSSTLPIPVPAGKASSSRADINGSSAVLIGDSTGIGSVVIWVRDGMVYAVGGTLADNVVVDVARSMQ
jgi:hypothetical protein